MKWPRGKYNGKRIGGFKVSVAVNFLWWLWKPRIEWRHGEYYILWLCFSVRGYVEYGKDATDQDAHIEDAQRAQDHGIDPYLQTR